MTRRFPLFGSVCGVLALLAGWWWAVTSAPALCRAVANQTQGCATLACQHNIAAILALLLAVMAITLVAKRL
jgi:hypothetical protein